MNPLNYNEKYSDLQKLEEYKVLNTYQKLMIIEMKIISESLNDISESLKADIVKLNYNNGSMITKELKNVRIAEIIHDLSRKI